MKKIVTYLPLAATGFFILLFTYAAVSKLLDFENFQVQIAQSPLLSAYAGAVSYVVIIAELVMVVLLAIPKYRITGLYASFGLMVAFTVYIYLILNYSDFVPCSCGGILEKLGWKEHLLFNILCVFFAALAVVCTNNEERAKSKGRRRFISKNGIILFGLLIMNAGIVTGLFYSSEYIMKKENNFTRRFIPHPIYATDYLDLKANSFYFAGNNGDTIFLGNREAPLLLAKIAPKSKKADFDTLKISDYDLPFKNVVLDVHYPFFSLSDGTVPVIYEGLFPGQYANKADVHQLYFSKLKMTEPHQYIFKATLTYNLESVIGLLNTEHNTVQFHPEILVKQKEGLFDTDGDFQIDTETKSFVYTYYYRNQYITSDLLLNNINKGNTIDTVSMAKIQLKKLATGVTKMSAPPIEVNEVQALHSNILYNVAKLRGRHESKSLWKDAKIVDVYDYKSKIYKYSFYVYNRKNEKMRSMIVTSHYFYALIGNELVRYKRRL